MSESLPGHGGVPPETTNAGAPTSPVATRRRRLPDAPLLAAATGATPSRRPVWFMRQAGRSLPEYREVRSGVGMLEACFNPDLVTEITVQPVRRHGVDAAILFSDIVVPLKAAGIDLDIVAGRGPVVDSPVRTAADVAALPQLQPAALGPIATAVGNLLGELGDTPLIGFAGAPFTLASYLIEGGPSRHHEHTKALMYSDPQTWHRLAAALADITATFLQVQLEAGVDAIQLFDSWVGALSLDDYREFVMPHSARVFAQVERYGVPRIHFGVGTGALLGAMGEAGADVVGVDWRTPLSQAVQLVGRGKALQGNLDPAILLASEAVITARAQQVVREADDALAAGAAGHIFNLGHGVLPETDPGRLTALVELVHEL